MTTNSFEVAFRFDGGHALQGVLDGSDHESATRASRRLLAVHAHCFLHTKVPSAAQSEGHGYHVRHVATYKGSHLDVWNVVINNAWTTQFVGGLIGAAYANEVKAGINAFARFLRDSVRAALGTGSMDLPEFRRTASVLEVQDGNGQSMIDIDAEHDSVRLRLRELTIQVLQDLARPVGRSASRLTILIEGEPVAIIEEEMKQLWLTDQISTAVAVLREQQQALLAQGATRRGAR